MQQSTLWNDSDRGGMLTHPIDATLEIGAYEALWSEHNASFKSIAEKFAANIGARPSDLVPEDNARAVAARVIAKVRERTLANLYLNVGVALIDIGNWRPMATPSRSAKRFR